MQMDDGDVHEQIARLEARIEQLTNTIERCRKIILLAKIAMTLGGMALLALMFGLISFNPLAMIGAISAALGGTVVFGSNTSTSQQAAADRQAAEALRAELISSIDLRVVGWHDLPSMEFGSRRLDSRSPPS